MNISKNKILKRERRNRALGFALLIIVGALMLPWLLASTPGALLAFPLMGGVVSLRRDPDAPGGGGGGGGAAGVMEKTAKALEALDAKLKGFEGKVTEVAGLKTDIEGLKTNFNEIKTSLDDVKKSRLLAVRSGPRTPGEVSEACAREIAAHFIMHCERSGKIEALCSRSADRDHLLDTARSVLGISVKTALSTNDIPLPTNYGSEIKSLVSEFGVVRRKMSPYPIGMGTARPARMGTRPAFGSIAMSAAIGEKSPTLNFASLESHKIGGIVRLPREIDEQSIVPMGQFLARYGAVEFARAEDSWGFNADGSAAFEQVSGIVQIARDNAKTVVLANTKTKPSDATLDDFRALRRKVNKAALNGSLSAYYLDTTWETRLAAFKTAAEPNVYQRLPDGSAILDGYPIVWTDVLTPYGTEAVADEPLAVFGALSFWWMGEHGSPRIDTSEHVWFANDQLAVRFLEEIDFDYAALDATAVLLTAAA